MGRRLTTWNRATKFRVAMEAYEADRNVAEIAEEYGIHPTQAHRWKKELIDHGPDIFAGKHDDEQ